MTMQTWKLPGIDIEENVPGALVHNAPPVYLLGLNTGENAPGLLRYDEFLDHPVRHFFFVNPMWSFASAGYKDKVLPRLNEIAERFPQHCYSLLINDVADWNIREQLDPRIEMHVCGEHALADTSKFTLQPQKHKFAAVYIAQNSAYKRIHLAAKIDRLCLISKGLRPEDFAKIKSTIPNLYSPNVEQGLLNPTQVAELLNASATGLILSALEGQNRATIEYLMCGLPVVSTINRGGRDRFLSPSNSIYVSDMPEAIAEAVAFVSRSGFDRELIAYEAARSVMRERQWLSHIVDSTLEKRGCAPIGIFNKPLPHHGFSASNSMSFVLRQRYAALNNGS
jgi:glycosyltransferase involved in cell wall biosynthesis